MFGKKALVAVGAMMFALNAVPSQAAWPERPIELIVPWGAGGGTDTVARMLASVMEKDLGQPINVVNRTGGAGIIGHTALAQARPDGYTVGTVNVDLSQMVCLGQSDLTAAKFNQIALFSRDPAGLMVNADSPYKSAKQLLDALKSSKDNAMKASGTGRGGIYHLAFAGWLMKEGVDPNKVPWVPSKGEAPSIKDLASGSIDLITPPLASARAMIEAGKIRPLATMAEERNPLFPDVPTLKEATGANWASGTWRMLATPVGVSPDITKRLEAAVKKAYDSKEFQDFMKSNGFVTAWMDSAQAKAFHAAEDKAICEVMKTAGMLEQQQ